MKGMGKALPALGLLSIRLDRPSDSAVAGFTSNVEAITELFASHLALSFAVSACLALVCSSNCFLRSRFRVC